MTLLRSARSLAARFGVHAVRMSSLPSTSMMGLVHRPIDLILDVGANCGQFAHEMRTKFPTAHIVSFEPNPTAFGQLQCWAENDGNARALNVAVGDVDDMLEMHIQVEHTASTTLLPTSDLEIALFPQTRRQERLQVRVRRLDDVLADNGIEVGPNTFLKFDIQGFEDKALRGAPQTLSRVGALMTEVFLAEMYEGQADFLTIASIARDFGLRYSGNYEQIVGADGRVMWLDAMFLR
jgi:FkbM family methyltransferase